LSAATLTPATTHMAFLRCIDHRLVSVLSLKSAHHTMGVFSLRRVPREHRSKPTLQKTRKDGHAALVKGSGRTPLSPDRLSCQRPFQHPCCNAVLRSGAIKLNCSLPDLSPLPGYPTSSQVIPDWRRVQFEKLTYDSISV
jgi:hypothetical protein